MREVGLQVLLLGVANANGVYEVNGPTILKDGRPTVFTGVNTMHSASTCRF